MMAKADLQKIDPGLELAVSHVDTTQAAGLVSQSTAARAAEAQRLADAETQRRIDEAAAASAAAATAAVALTPVVQRTAGLTEEEFTVTDPLVNVSTWAPAQQTAWRGTQHNKMMAAVGGPNSPGWQTPDPVAKSKAVMAYFPEFNNVPGGVADIIKGINMRASMKPPSPDAAKAQTMLRKYIDSRGITTEQMANNFKTMSTKDLASIRGILRWGTSYVGLANKPANTSGQSYSSGGGQSEDQGLLGRFLAGDPTAPVDAIKNVFSGVNPSNLA